MLNPHPFLLAAWVGLFATMLNLLPLGQLDGGHILYAAIGSWQRRLAWPMWVALLLLGLLWPGWWLWSAFVLLIGSATPASTKRRCRSTAAARLVAAAWLVFVLCFMPEPIAIVELPAHGPVALDGQVARRELEHQSHRSVVDQLDRHRGAEAAALDRHAEPAPAAPLAARPAARRPPARAAPSNDGRRPRSVERAA